MRIESIAIIPILKNQEGERCVHSRLTNPAREVLSPFTGRDESAVPFGLVGWRGTSHQLCSLAFFYVALDRFH